MISPLAHIDPAARIGNNVKVDPFAVIQGDVTIGDGCHIMSNAIIMDSTIMGENCNIFPGAVIGAVPQDLKFIGEKTTTEIGDNTTIREFVTISRGTKDKWKTVVGSNCLIMAYSHIAHDCILGNHVILANGVQLAGHVIIDDYAILGGMSGVAQFAHIGAHCYIAGHSEINKDVPPFIKAGRNPLSYAGINSVGLQRRGFSNEKINEILDVYRHIFYKGMNTTQALDYVKDNLPQSGETDDIISFIKNSERGILKLFSKESTDDN